MSQLPASGRVRVIRDGAPAWGRLTGGEIALDSGELADPAGVEWLPPVEPSKIIAVHLTYRSRLEEYEAQPGAAPSYFMKPPSALSGHLREIPRPAGTRFLNYEGELAVIVGRRMRGVPEAEALDYVAGFSPANDVGLHDFRHADRGSMLRVKGQDGFLPIGPAVVPASDWHPRELELRTYLNGEVVQRATSQDVIWGPAYLLADLCRLITLEPGDVVLTGTPANSRPMSPGDLVEVEIAGLGRLSNPVGESRASLSGPGEQPLVTAQTLHVALALPEEEAAARVAAEEGVR